MRAVLPFTAARFARAIVMPNLQAAGHDHRAGARLPRAHPGRVARGLRLRAADDAVPDRSHRAGGGRPRARRPASYTASSSTRPAPRPIPMPASPTSAKSTPCSTRMAELGLRPAGAWRSDRRRTSTCSIARRVSSTSVLAPLRRDFPELADRLRAHHHDAPPSVRARSARAASPRRITPQHLLHNRNALFAGGIRPHHYCLPVLKTRADRAGAAGGGRERQIRASSSAPTARRTRAQTKEAACGCAGIFTAHAGIELYAEAFEAARRARQLEGSPRTTAPISTACRATRDASRSSRRHGRCRRTIRSAPMSSCRCAPASTSRWRLAS